MAFSGSEAEIERMVVRIMGDASHYERTLRDSASLTKSWTATIGKSLTRVGKQMSAMGRSLTLRVTAPIVGMGVAAIITGANFQKAFTGVQKTVDATDAELADLRQGFKSLALEVPLSVEELLKIGESAGQLGIQTENILEFSRTMAALGVATNLTSEEAATAFARFANIVGMSQTKFSNLGSSVVALGNSLATTESEIVSMAMRLAGAGTTVGLSESQILAFAASLSSVGLQAEAGGTSFSKLFLNIQTALALGNKDLEEFARVSGKTVEQFSKDFEESAAGAVRDLLTSIGKLDAKAKVVALEDLGLAESVRMTDSILRMSGAIDTLDNALVISDKAFKENTALAEEAAKAYETFWSKVILLKNTIKDQLERVFIIIEPTLRRIIDHAVRLATKFGELSTETRKYIILGALIAAVVGPALVIIGGILSMLGLAVTGLSIAAGFLAPLIPVIAAVGLVLAGAVLWVREFGFELSEVDKFIMNIAVENFKRLADEVNRLVEAFGGLKKIFTDIDSGITPAEMVVGAIGRKVFGTGGGISGGLQTKRKESGLPFDVYPEDYDVYLDDVAEAVASVDAPIVKATVKAAVQAGTGFAPLQAIQAAGAGTAEAQSRIMAFRSTGPEASYAERTADKMDEAVDLLTEIRDGEGTGGLTPANLGEAA